MTTSQNQKTRRCSEQSGSSSNGSVSSRFVRYSDSDTNRRSSRETIFSVSSLMSAPKKIFHEKRASLGSLREQNRDMLRRSVMLRKSSLADGRRNKVSGKIRKFSLQVANGIQELFDENGKLSRKLGKFN